MRTHTLTALLLTGSLLLAPAAVYAAPSGAGLSVYGSVNVSGNTATTGASFTSELDLNPIIITRSGVDNDTSTTSNASASGAVSVRAALERYVRALVEKDANISAVILSEDEVALTYREPAWLFGFLKITVPVRVSVTASGESDVDYPWYRFLMATGQNALRVRTQVIVDQHIPEDVRGSAEFSADTEMRLLAALQTMLKSESEAAVTSNAD